MALFSVFAQAQTHFEDISGNPTSDTWTLFLTNVTIEGEEPEDGDELGIFDGSTLVGVYVFDGDEDFENSDETDHSVIAFSTLSDGPGYTAGNSVTYKIWDSSEDQEYTGMFSAGEVYVTGVDDDAWDESGSDAPTFPAGDDPFSFFDLEFITGGTISGEVTLDNSCNGEITDVLVEVRGKTSGDLYGTDYADSDGNYSVNGLPLGNSAEYTVDAILDDHSSNGPKERTLTNNDPNETANFDLTPHSGDIEGNLSDAATGSNIANADVVLYNSNDNIIKETSTGSGGNYFFTELCVGDYYLVISHDDYEEFTSDEFSIEDGDDLTNNYQLDPMPGDVEGKVKEKNNGDPIQDAVVTITDYNQSPPETLFNGVTDGSGDYYAEDIPAGTWDVVATGGNYSTDSIEVTVAANQVTEADDIELSPSPGVLEGTVRDEGSSELLSDVEVKIYISGQPNPTTTTDNNGFYQIEDVPVGTYDVEFSKSGYETYTEEDVEIASLTATTVSPYLNKEPGSFMVKTTNVFNADGEASVTIGSDYTAERYEDEIPHWYYFEELPPGTYDILIEHDDFHNYTIEDVEIETGEYDSEEVTLTPYNWEAVSGNTFEPVWTVFLQTVTLDGEPVEANDEIAVYDGNTIVGVYHVDGELGAGNATNQDLTAYAELNNGIDGFIAGNDYKFKLYDASENEVIVTPVVTLDDHNDNAAYEGTVFPSGDAPYSFAKLEFFAEETITLQLEEGYQIVSSRVQAEDMDMDELIIGSGIRPDLIYFKDELAEKYFKTAGSWVNNIDDWENTEGYLVKMDNDATFTMTGTPVDPQMDIPLNNGYSFISYLYDEPMDAATAFSSIHNELIFVRDTEGKHYWKIGGNWVNNIGDLKPGEGYFVKTTAATTFNYPAAKSGSAVTEDSEPQHFNFTGGDATNPVYTVYVEGDQLQTGDEIAAFDGDVMVGAAVIENPSESEENALSLFSVVDNGEGYKAGNQITFKIWSQEKDEVYTNIEVDYLNPHGDAYTDNTFPEEDGAYSIIKTSLSELDVSELDSETAMNVYPNPATDHLNITTEEDITQVRVLNASGQVMLQKEINNNEYSLNVGNLDAGIYILQTTFKNRQSSLRFAVK